jgi:hypothetical protein
MGRGGLMGRWVFRSTGFEAQEPGTLSNRVVAVLVLLPPPGGTNPVMVFRRGLPLVGGGANREGLARTAVALEAGGGIRGKGRTGLETSISFEAESADGAAGSATSG